MQNKDSAYYKDWFVKAEQDWKRMEILLGADDTEGAGFYIQQSLEKYLKGFLISKGWKLQRIHDLEKLLNIAIKYYPQFETYRPICEQITEYYTNSCYPIFSNYTPTSEEIVELKKISIKLVKKLKELAQIA